MVLSFYLQFSEVYESRSFHNRIMCINIQNSLGKIKMVGQTYFKEKKIKLQVRKILYVISQVHKSQLKKLFEKRSVEMWLRLAVFGVEKRLRKRYKCV